MPNKKEKSRSLIVQTIADLHFKLCESGNWKLNMSSFECSEEMPLDFVEFNEETRRYQYTFDRTEEVNTSENNKKRSPDKDENLGFTEDDLIAQSMIVYLLYRMEKGWGKHRSFQALSIWGGKVAQKDADDGDPFPLENLWVEEIKECIESKKLGKPTLCHEDYFAAFPKLYGNPKKPNPKKRYFRRSKTFISQVHILSEQAAIQMALYLHEHVSEHYAMLAGMIIHYALNFGGDDPEMMPKLADCIMGVARKEPDDYPKAVFEEIEKEGQQNSAKKARIDPE